MALRVHDTRRREKVPFTTMRPGRVSMYVCGVTVYDRCHLGHARCYLAFDLIHRWLEASGYDVDYVQNFTDVDDKIIARANEARDGDWLGLVDEMIEGYYEDMDALNILRADHYPRCTEHVDGMVSIIEDLIERGHAYAADDGVYFDVSSAPEKYGQLTGQSFDAVRAGAGGRVDGTGGGKRDHRDFALWKAAKPGEPTWPSPWGEGRPGWHIECSAMSTKFLGAHFDIHCGGVDNKFPHHENELAQSVCSLDSPFVNYWLHSEFLTVEGKKMSKSLNNYYIISDLVEKGFTYEDFRFIILSAHYRSKVNFSIKRKDEARAAYDGEKIERK